MAFKAEDGTGYSDANSYITVEEADDYHADRGNSDWAGSGMEKKAALIKATAYIEANFPWSTGQKANWDQALGWPRVGAEDIDGYDIEFDVIPLCVKHACAELALESFLGTLWSDETEQTVVSETVGPLSVTYKEEDVSTASKSLVEGLLRGLYGSSYSHEVFRG
jgi:hypothetical protein